MTINISVSSDSHVLPPLPNTKDFAQSYIDLPHAPNLSQVSKNRVESVPRLFSLSTETKVVRNSVFRLWKTPTFPHPYRTRRAADVTETHVCKPHSTESPFLFNHHPRPLERSDPKMPARTRRLLSQSSSGECSMSAYEPKSSSEVKRPRRKPAAAKKKPPPPSRKHAAPGRKARVKKVTTKEVAQRSTKPQPQPEPRTRPETHDPRVRALVAKADAMLTAAETTLKEARADREGNFLLPSENLREMEMLAQTVGALVLEKRKEAFGTLQAADRFRRKQKALERRKNK
ncbi:hypothetical protein RUND412_003165 [Rhizina undulata]